jgi:hypothetical protein
VGILAAVQAVAELRQLLASGLRFHFSQTPNVAMMVVLASVYGVLAGDAFEWKNLDVLGYVLLLVWLTVLYFLAAFESTGPYVRTLFEIMGDVRYFAVLYLLVSVAFSVSMNVHRIDQLEAEADGVFAFAALSLESTYRMGTLGDFETDSYENIPAVYVMFLLCTFFVTVVFLNVLIAVISDTFDKIQEVQDSSRVKGMAQAVYDVEAVFGAFTRPSYIFFSHCVDGKDEWSGRVAAITSAVRSRCAETDMKIDSLDTKMETLDSKFAALDAKMAKMEAKSDAKFAVLLEKLDQLRPTTVAIEDSER